MTDSSTGESGREGIQRLPFREVAAILRGVDDLLGQSGRVHLAKLLKGSREARLLAMGLDASPVYGFFAKETLASVEERIDWVIQQGYLTSESRARCQVLVYTMRGWEIEKETMANELLRGFNDLAESGITLFNMNYLKGRNRELIALLLDKVLSSRDAKYIPVLEAWEKVDYDKTCARIRGIISELRKAG